MRIVSKGFYTVVVLNVSMFESVITDERHFSTLEEAEQFKKESEGETTTAVIIQID